MLFRHIVEKIIQLTSAGESEEGQRLDAVIKHLQSLPMETLVKISDRQQSVASAPSRGFPHTPSATGGR